MSSSSERPLTRSISIVALPRMMFVSGADSVADRSIFPEEFFASENVPRASTSPD